MMMFIFISNFVIFIFIKKIVVSWGTFFWKALYVDAENINIGFDQV